LKMNRIPIAAPDLSGREEQYVVEAIRSSWISSSGSFLPRFEKEFAEICGTDSAIAVCNGTVALHLALLGLGLQPGDEVIVPSLTFIATSNAVRYIGATPVFVDVDPATWCIDPRLIAERITARTKGIIAVHLYGHPADMDAIQAIADAHGLWVVEDAAEAPWGKYKGRRVGSLADLGTFSFYGNKIITSGEGGAVSVKDSKLEAHLRMLRGQGMDPQRRYFFPIIGHNFRMTNICGALLCAQLERATEMLDKRRYIFAQYQEELRGVPGIEFQPVAEWAELSPWLFCCLVNEEEFGGSSAKVMEELARRGIETRPFFIPIHTLPPYQSAGGSLSLPVTEYLGRCGISLPTHSQLTEAEITQVTACIAEIQKSSSKS
jgi:perosamine synthetase